MNKLLMMFCASILLTSCAVIFDDDETSVNGCEIETSYIAINLMAADPDTRADEQQEPAKEYQDGLTQERAVKTAYFFFFQNGQPFPVTVTDGSVTAPGATAGANFLSASLTTSSTNASANISDLSNVVLLLRNYKGQYPNQIVAVLNWVPESGMSYTLEELKAAVYVQSTMDSQKYFVMSNAVYADAAGQAVTTTPLSIANIFTKEADAKSHPIQIYVERAAAKVTVTAPAEKKFDISKNVNSVKAYAQLTGWELYNDYSQSYLLKQIDPKWTVENIGFNWNDKEFYRSYWAISPEQTLTGNTFTWNGGSSFGLSTNVNSGTYISNTYVYCGENTTSDAEKRTKVILKAKLVKENGEAIELARWYGTDYLGESALLTAVANTLKNSYYNKAVGESGYTSIAPEDLMCVVGGGTDAPGGVDATEVYFQLSKTGAAKTWYEYSSAGGYTAVTVTVLNGKLKSVPSAVVYKNGQTYYYFDIKHLGAAGKAAEYGIVRNHIYSININSITGFGSPVYNNTANIETPKYPEFPNENGSFVSAQVNILSWRMVSQGVDITPGN